MRLDLWWLPVLLSGCGTQSETSFVPLRLERPIASVELVREAHDAANGGYDLFQPARPIAVNGSVWLLDIGNDQVVRFDTTLATARAFSREGEGPGEIQYAMDMQLAGDRLLVAEIGNGRVSTFDTTGTFRGTTKLVEGPQFIADLDHRLVTTLQFSRQYAYRVDDRGALQSFASIPSTVEALAKTDPERYPAAGPYIASTPKGDLVVLDQSVLVLSRFDRNGRLLRSGPLPEPIRSRLLDQRIKKARAFGKLSESFVDSPAAKTIAIDRSGRMLLLFPLPDSWGMVIDLDRWSAKPLRLPEDRRLHDILWAASDGALDGDRIWVVSGSQLYEFAAQDLQ